MNEAIEEGVPKDKHDVQPHRRDAAHTDTAGERSSPSDRQRMYILTLARMAGLTVDVSAIRDKASASRCIDTLRIVNRRMHGAALSVELRDKRIAFGMATKLVFQKYLDRHKEVRRSEKFWIEVAELYFEYQKRQQQILRVSVTLPSDS